MRRRTVLTAAATSAVVGAGLAARRRSSGGVPRVAEPAPERPALLRGRERTVTTEDGVDLLPAHPSLEAVGVALAAQGGLVSAVRRVLRPVVGDYDHVVIDTHGDLGNLTLSAVAAADAVLTVFTSDPGSALGAVRVSAFLDQHRRFENTSAVLLGVACSLWDREGRAAREVAGALEGTGLPLMATRIPLSR